jgi:hypothetical protein
MELELPEILPCNTEFGLGLVLLWLFPMSCGNGLLHVLLFNLVKPKLVTDTPEWKAAEKELLIREKQNPFSGPYAEVLKKESK